MCLNWINLTSGEELYALAHETKIMRVTFSIRNSANEPEN
jgi:hypothetical protein